MMRIARLWSTGKVEIMDNGNPEELFAHAVQKNPEAFHFFFVELSTDIF